MALRLHALVFSEGFPNGVIPGASLVPFRDLGAVVAEAPYELVLPDEAILERQREVVEAVARRGAVLPAPPGTVFRSRQALEQWIELHYVALSDALAFVDDRVGARVHVRRADAPRDEREAGADLAAVAAECFRVLRRQAVASVQLRSEHATGIAVSSAFLVERELWGEFKSAVEEEQERSPSLEITLTGPWPPYDFVRMQLGG